MRHNGFAWVAIALLGVLAIYSTFVVLGNPPRPRTRISVKSSTPLVFPPVCLVTGEPATEKHLVRSFKGALGFYYSPTLQEIQIALPFSTNGWEQYCRQSPLSLKALEFVFGIGLHILGTLNRIPLVNIFFVPVLAVWLDVLGLLPIALLLWPIAIVDLLGRRRRLFKLHGIRVKDGETCGIDISVVNSLFAQEMARLNPNTTIGKRWWQLWK